MPIIIFTAHGQTVSDNDTLTAASCLTALRKADDILACLPEELRIPRPLVFSATDNESCRTAELIASCWVSGFGRCPALDENSEPAKTRAFAGELLKKKRPCLVVTHAATIDLLIANIAARIDKDAVLVRPIAFNEVLAIDTDKSPLDIVRRSTRTTY